MSGVLATLAAEPEPSDDGAVTRVVLLDQVSKKASTLADELEEAASRMAVLGEAGEMAIEAPDPLRQECDLDLWRTGVTFIGGIPGDDLLLLFPRERHSFLPFTNGLSCSIYDRRRVAKPLGTGKYAPLPAGCRCSRLDE